MAHCWCFIFGVRNERMNTIIKITVLSFAIFRFAFANSFAGTEDGITSSLSLRQCMEYAVANSTKMRIQAADRSDEQVARRDAVLNMFTPSVSGDAYAYNRYGRSIDPETNTYINTVSFNNAYSVSASITLFNGFSAVNNLKITKTMQLMGLSKDRQEEDAVCLATMEAFCNVAYYKQLCEIIEVQKDAAQSSLLLAQRQESLGQKGHADVVQMEADLADKEYQLTNTRNLYHDALITLKDVMFYPMDEPLEIDASSLDLVSEKGSLDTDAASIAEYALKYNPSAIIAKGTMDNAHREWNTAKWQLLPRLSFYAGWSTSYYTYPGQEGYTALPFNDQFKNNMGEYVELALSIPIFDRLSAHSNITNKKNAYLRASAEYDQKLKDVENEVYRAVRDRDGAEAEYLSADRLAEVQKEAYSLNARKFEQGLISGIEYQTATGKWLEAQATRLNARFKYIIKSCVVQYYNGTPYIEMF